MPRVTSLLLLFVASSLPAAAEEIVLKDGTKIVGRMSTLTSDKIEVETAYGKMQLKRTDILTISFPENTPKTPSESTPEKMDAPKIVDESQEGVNYLNRTAKFSLVLAQDWVIDSEIHRAPETLTVLSSRDKSRFLMVMQESYPGSLDSYKDLTLLAVRKNLTNFEELAESKVTIDGKGALLVFYRGVSAKGGLPMAFASAIIPSGTTYTKMTVWCVEPLFHDMQSSFEKMLMSYRSTGQTTVASAPSKP